MNIDQPYHQRNELAVAPPPPLQQQEEDVLQNRIVPIRHPHNQPHIIPMYDDKSIVSSGNSRRGRRHDHHRGTDPVMNRSHSSSDERRRCQLPVASSSDGMMMMKDCIDLFEQCYDASCEVGSCIVKREIMIVNQRLLSFVHKPHECDDDDDETSPPPSAKPPKKKKNRSSDVKNKSDETEEEGDVRREDALPTNDTDSHGGNSSSSSSSSNDDEDGNTPMTKKRRISFLPEEEMATRGHLASVRDNDDMVSRSTEEESVCRHRRRRCLLLWERANRMKRWSSLFRQMEHIQRTILQEMKESFSHEHHVER